MPEEINRDKLPFAETILAPSERQKPSPAEQAQRLSRYMDAQKQTIALETVENRDREDHLNKLREKIFGSAEAEQNAIRSRMTLEIPASALAATREEIAVALSKQKGLLHQGDVMYGDDAGSRSPQQFATVKKGVDWGTELPPHDVTKGERTETAMFSLADLQRAHEETLGAKAEAQAKQDLATLDMDDIDAAFDKASSGSFEVKPAEKEH